MTSVRVAFAAPASPAQARLAGTRRTLALAAVLRPVLAALAVALAVAAAGIVAGALTGARLVSAGGAVAAVAIVAWGVALAARGWRRTTTGAAALWVEGAVPSLDYAMATLADPRAEVPAATRARLEARVAATAWEPRARAALRRAVAAPAVALVLAGVALAFAPRVAERATLARAARDVASAAAANVADRAPPGLAFTVRVVPPAYTGLRARDLGAVASVGALEGSTVELRGGGRPAGLTATLGDRPLAPAAAGDGWRLAFAMPPRAGVLRVSRDGRSRLLALEPHVDSAPALALRLPRRDTVMRAPTGALALAADVRDDLGLSAARLEYIVSSGEGETFEFRSGTLGARRLGGARGATVGAALDLGALALEPGDVVHVRAVARDANPSGALAASETRTLRVMRRGEADSVAVEAAPPPEVDKSVLSQRMLIRMTEALIARAPRLARADLVAESRRIAIDQKRLRRAVGEVVFARLGGEGSAEHAHSAGDGHEHSDDELKALRTPEQVLAEADRATGRGVDGALDFEGDETPVVAINRPLLEAYNAMWDASLALDVAEPREALPPMRRALEAIQRARAAERIYLRGRPPAVVVDLARVRLAGKERGEGTERSARAALPDASRMVTGRLARAALLAARDAGAAADSLLLLRVAVLGDDPLLARALGDAADALRRGGDATGALVRARRVAAGGARAGAAPGAWRGAWGGTP